jgi:hypothetical protein
MRNPNRHEQPAEGGVEQVEGALQKQSEPPPKQRKEPDKSTPKERKTDAKH